MVSANYVGGLLARASWLSSLSSNSDAVRESYKQNTLAGVETLQKWYDRETGLWDSTGWWNSANCLTTLADLANLQNVDMTDAGINIADILQNTYEQAQETQVTASKVIDTDGLPRSSYVRIPKLPKTVGTKTVSKRGFDNFLNDYYDDEGWWALAMIASHDIGVQGLGDQEYIQAAVEIFEDMHKGNSSCGGIYWSKVGTYTNAIANELFLKVAASLANRMSNKQYYLDIAVTQWNWFKNIGLINSDNLINDGLDDSCHNNGQKTWSYNQGVVLGGLVELYKATSDASYLVEAQTIASAAINLLSVNGTLVEGCEPNCGSDGNQFKGVFLRNLAQLQNIAPKDTYKAFIMHNADSIWNSDNNQTQFGVAWAGPYTTADAGSQSSALDAMVAAISVT